MLYTSSWSEWCRTWYGLCMMRWKSASSIDSANSVRLGVSGEYRPLRTQRCKNACKRWRSAVEAKRNALTAYRSLPMIIVIDTMYGFPDKVPVMEGFWGHVWLWLLFDCQAAKHSTTLACLMITYPSTHGVFDEGIRYKSIRWYRYLL